MKYAHSKDIKNMNIIINITKFPTLAQVYM